MAAHTRTRADILGLTDARKFRRPKVRPNDILGLSDAKAIFPPPSPSPIEEIDDLVCYYKLGEAGPYPTGAASSGPITVSAFAHDSSGNGNHLDALNYLTGATGPMFETGNANLPVCGVPGAPPGGDNDAIRFNYDYVGFGGGDDKRCCLRSLSSNPQLESYGLSVGTGSTFTCWIKRLPGKAPYARLVSTWYRTFGVGNFGARVGFDATGHLKYVVGADNVGTEFSYTTPDVMAADTWHHFLVTYEKTGTSSGHRRIWVNSELVSDTTHTLSPDQPPRLGTMMSLGGGNGLGEGSSDVAFSFTSGEVDEVAYWNRVLTDDELGGIGVVPEDEGEEYDEPDPSGTGIVFSFTEEVVAAAEWTRVDEPGGI